MYPPCRVSQERLCSSVPVRGLIVLYSDHVPLFSLSSASISSLDISAAVRLSKSEPTKSPSAPCATTSEVRGSITK